MKIRKRGSVDVKLKSGKAAALWYDRCIRLWVLQLLDSEGNQIGPGVESGAEYFHDREDAGEALKQIVYSDGGLQ